MLHMLNYLTHNFQIKQISFTTVLVDGTETQDKFCELITGKNASKNKIGHILRKNNF